MRLPTLRTKVRIASDTPKSVELLYYLPHRNGYEQNIYE